MAPSSASAFPYVQPALSQLLVVGSFLYFLNVIRVLADHFAHAGIVAELLLGVIYGTPLANILPQDWEATFSTLGYLGLVWMVFEEASSLRKCVRSSSIIVIGGLSTNLPVLFSNLPLSCLCALTGITLPIAFSFALLSGGFGYGNLEAFAAGAALSSTSLGTTLAALNSVSRDNYSIPEKFAENEALSDKNEGIIANAVQDVRADPMDLVDRAQWRTDHHSKRQTTSLRPVPSASLPSRVPSSISLQQTRIGTILVSAAILDDVVGLVIAALIPALVTSSSSGSQPPHFAWTLIRPLLSSILMASLTPPVARFILRPAFWFHSIGEQWCAPASIGKSWGWSHLSTKAKMSTDRSNSWGTEAHADAVKLAMMVCTLGAFAAIAYYTGSSVLFGAYIAGLTLTYVSKLPVSTSDDTNDGEGRAFKRSEALSFESTFTQTIGPLQQYLLVPLFFASIGYAIPFLSLWNGTIFWRGIVYAVLMSIGKLMVGVPIILWTISPHLYQSFGWWWKACSNSKYAHRRDPQVTGQLPLHTSWRSTFTASIYPAMFTGIAMVSRGEIGLLIAEIARHGPVISDSDVGQSSGLLGDEAFLVCIWAILICTLIGPIGVAFVVRRWGEKVTHGRWT
ncbi:uncharacterized protein FIBRA_08132 [Fibroporia radiculosa]|uniref:Cation/H+ exchanger transmembrane domain-containing protein n=1 Tax=Fibroporia radiculosa TaxID=599839 RepID=J4H504_9APHY|nr:uncharacterized protein FIBRA_08132 [Fibroporia radiculosa]CCM05894.1 predicted protein [Fibroporia radiculosa]